MKENTELEKWIRYKSEYKLDSKMSDRIETTLTGEKQTGGYVLMHTNG